MSTRMFSEMNALIRLNIVLITSVPTKAEGSTKSNFEFKKKLKNNKRSKYSYNYESTHFTFLYL